MVASASDFDGGCCSTSGGADDGGVGEVGAGFRSMVVADVLGTADP